MYYPDGAEGNNDIAKSHNDGSVTTLSIILQRKLK
jgi:hypothetical protein